MTLLGMTGSSQSCHPFSSCPLDTEGAGLCTDPCSAFIDLNGDNYCDRVSPTLSMSAGSVQSDAVGTARLELPRTFPFGLTNDPYPGQYKLYIDTDGDGICVLSEPARIASANALEESASSAPPNRRRSPPSSLCERPLTLFNAPSLGGCRRYANVNGKKICDLSEPELIASGQVDCDRCDTNCGMNIEQRPENIRSLEHIRCQDSCNRTNTIEPRLR